LLYMKRNISDTVNNWLTSKKVNFVWLPVFRISIGVFCLLHFITLLPDIRLFLSPSAIIPPDILQGKASTVVPTLYGIAKFLGYPSVTETIIYSFSVLYIVSLIMLAIGMFSRVSAIFATFLHLIFMNSMTFYIYGVDCFCNVALFYCIVFPVGHFYSLDQRLFKNRKFNAAFANYCLLLLQIHICIAYVFGGIDKLLGFNWWNGESVWKAIHLIESPRNINVDYLAKTPVFMIAGWATIIIELFYPVFVNIRKTRNLWLFLIIGMHLSIAFLLGLYFFSTFMVMFNMLAYYLPYYKKEVLVTKPINNQANDNSLRLQM
jgi:hypothetical protein